MAVWYSLWSFGIFFPVLVWLQQEKSGNPELYVVYCEGNSDATWVYCEGDDKL
jgi:hypothetical protein